MLAVSPNLSFFKELLKEPTSAQRFMPVWTLSELVAARERLYAHVPVVRMLELYGMWGGIPRYVLEKSASDQEMKVLMNALSSTTATAILSSVNAAFTADTFSGKLIHIVVGDGVAPCRYDFTQYSLDYASPLVKEMLLKQFDSEVIGGLEGMLASTRRGPYLQYAQGHIFEDVVHQKLRAGGTFPLRG